MTRSRPFTTLGLILGVIVAAVVTIPQIRADLAGVPIMGPAEAMFILSLPLSVVTWGVLLLVTLPFKSDLLPTWLAYLWLVATPILNWMLLGWLVDRWRRSRYPFN